MTHKHYCVQCESKWDCSWNRTADLQKFCANEYDSVCDDCIREFGETKDRKWKTGMSTRRPINKHGSKLIDGE